MQNAFLFFLGPYMLLILLSGYFYGCKAGLLCVGDSLFCYDAFQRNGNLDWGQQLCDDLSVLYRCFFLCDQRGLVGKADDRRNLFLFYHVGLCDVRHLFDSAGSF